MLKTLDEAGLDDCGGKAAALAMLRKHGLPVPDGFVVPFEVFPAEDPGPTQPSNSGYTLPVGADEEIAVALVQLGHLPVAVRSSAADEDTAEASAAGLFDSVLGVRGVRDVCSAILKVWFSYSTDRAETYRRRADGDEFSRGPRMAVLIQTMIDAGVSGVMFTPQRPGGSTRIEAAWGLGLGVVGGTITPDIYEVDAAGTIRHSIGTKSTRADMRIRPDDVSDGIDVTAVEEAKRAQRTLSDEGARMVAELGGRVAEVLGGAAQDIEWALADGKLWVLQARRITAPLPELTVGFGNRSIFPPEAERSPSERVAVSVGAVIAAHGPDEPQHMLTGTPGSRGMAEARARIVRGPADFASVNSGEIIVCPFTDPAWTPLLAIAAGVVTETGGTLSHAAIVAREFGIPAVLGLAEATSLIADGNQLVINGATGTVGVH